ncbi:Anaphase-promoting complex subunit 4 [Linnemannia zychae]|nr:Anaphase-promoting complex subunit 4 [Linnemannia zychae]
MMSASTVPTHHVSAPQESPQDTFYPYSENHIPINHKLEAWCPTADLIALVNEDRLELYRLSWRLHWSIVIKAPVSSTQNNFSGGVHTSWNRSSGIARIGKAIAVGLANSGVNIYDYRDGSLISSIQSTGTGGNTQKSTLKALPLLSSIPPTSAQQQLLERTMFNKGLLGAGGMGATKSGINPDESCAVQDEESSAIMNVLFAGDQHGVFMLRLFEGFDTISLSMTDLMKLYSTGYDKSNLNILKADMQLNLSEITVIACETQVRMDQNHRNNQRLLQITLNSNLLDKHSQEIRMLGLQKRPINNLLKYLNDGLQVMNADYTKISQMAEDCIDCLQKSLTSFKANSTPTYEFIQMLLTGCPSESMGFFLQHEFSIQDLKRWDKSAKAAYKNLQRVATDKYEPLRLDEALVYDCIVMVGDFMGIIQGFFQAIKIEQKQFAEFENWLEQTLEKMNPPVRGPDDPADEGQKDTLPVDIKEVSQYLKAGLLNSGLESFFREREETSPCNSRHEDARLNITPADQSISSKKATNAFAGSAIFTAMTSRGFGLSSSKKPASSPLFKKPSTLTLQSSQIKPPEGSGHTLPEQSTKLALVHHLKLMTMRCQAIFDCPQKTLSDSIRVSKVMEILELGSEINNDAAMENIENINWLTIPKFATRYCYNSMQPWHYLVICLGPSENVHESILAVLRSRQAPRQVNRKYDESESMASLLEQKLGPTNESQSRKRKVSGSTPKNFSSDLRTLLLAKPVDITSAKRRPEEPITSTFIDHDRIFSLEEWDVEMAVYSLQEHDTTHTSIPVNANDGQAPHQSAISEKMDNTKRISPSLALTKIQQTLSMSEQRPIFEVRDLTFLDDDSICLLLNSTRKPSAVTGTSEQQEPSQEDQFVVSMPLLTPNRPYQSLSTLLSNDAPGNCVLNKLIHNLNTRSKDTHVDVSTASTSVSRAVNVYTLPIERSRCVTPLNVLPMMDIDGALPASSFLNPASDSSLDTDARQQKDLRKHGPMRVACNDREKGQVISVHSHNKITVLDV